MFCRPEFLNSRMKSRELIQRRIRPRHESTPQDRLDGLFMQACFQFSPGKDVSRDVCIVQ